MGATLRYVRTLAWEQLGGFGGNFFFRGVYLGRGVKEQRVRLSRAGTCRVRGGRAVGWDESHARRVGGRGRWVSWAGLDCAGLTGVDWIGLDWLGLDWTGLDRTG